MGKPAEGERPKIQSPCGFSEMCNCGFHRFPQPVHEPGEKALKTEGSTQLQNRCWPITVMTGREKIHWFVDFAGL